jgi:hypothetical protein
MKLENIPAISQGNEVLNAIQQLSTQISTQQQLFSTQISTISTQIGGLRNDMVNSLRTM